MSLFYRRPLGPALVLACTSLAAMPADDAAAQALDAGRPAAAAPANAAAQRPAPDVHTPQGGTAPASTGFTYQGRLVESGVPANGVYDMIFSLYNLDGLIVAPQVALANIPCDDGLFMVDLDFGPAFTGLAGQDLRLEVRVRTSGSPAYTTLSPRQPIRPAPVAQGLRLPFEAAADLAGPTITVSNAGNTDNSAGLLGTQGPRFVPPVVMRAGVRGESFAGAGVFGYSASDVGVAGFASLNGSGVRGQGLGNFSTGVFGINEFPDSFAVRGLVSGARGVAIEGTARFAASTGVQATAVGGGKAGLRALGVDGAAAAVFDGPVSIFDGDLDVSGTVITDGLRVESGTVPGYVLTATNAAGDATWLPVPPDRDEVITVLQNAGNAPAPAALTGFLTPTVDVTITSTTQRVFVSGTRHLGTTAVGGATGLRLFVGFRPAGSGTITGVSPGIFGIQLPQNAALPISLSGVLSNLAPGTYSVGLVGQVASPGVPASWNLNDFGYITAIVLD